MWKVNIKDASLTCKYQKFFTASESQRHFTAIVCYQYALYMLKPYIYRVFTAYPETLLERYNC